MSWPKRKGRLISIGSIMSSPLVTVEKETRCIEAIMIMREKGLRRLPVVDKGNIVGIVTLMSPVGNMPIRNVDLAELEVPAKYVNMEVMISYTTNIEYHLIYLFCSPSLFAFLQFPLYL